MDADAQARMLYLVLLGLFLVFVLARGGIGLGRLIRTLIVWGLIIAALALGYAIVTERNPPTASVSVSGEAIVLARGRDGHFHAEVAVNGRPLRFMIDTGATDIVLTLADAVAAGIDPAGLAYLGRAQTANGIVRTAAVRLDTLRLGPVTDTDVRATVSEGAMPTSLLGMAWLSRFERIEIAGNEMRLVR